MSDENILDVMNLAAIADGKRMVNGDMQAMNVGMNYL